MAFQFANVNRGEDNGKLEEGSYVFPGVDSTWENTTATVSMSIIPVVVDANRIREVWKLLLGVSIVLSFVYLVMRTTGMLVVTVTASTVTFLAWVLAQLLRSR